MTYFLFHLELQSQMSDFAIAHPTYIRFTGCASPCYFTMRHILCINTIFDTLAFSNQYEIPFLKSVNSLALDFLFKTVSTNSFEYPILIAFLSLYSGSNTIIVLTIHVLS